MRCYSVPRPNAQPAEFTARRLVAAAVLLRRRGLGLLGSRDLDQAAEGKYANYFRVGYNAYEFIIEFSQAYQAEESPRVHTRIITSPAYAQELLRTLQQSLLEYQQGHKGPV